MKKKETQKINLASKKKIYDKCRCLQKKKRRIFKIYVKTKQQVIKLELYHKRISDSNQNIPLCQYAFSIIFPYHIQFLEYLNHHRKS